MGERGPPRLSVDITVVLGTTLIQFNRYSGSAAVPSLEASEDDAVQILVNNLPVVKCTVVVNDNRIAIKLGKFLPRAGRALAIVFTI